MTANWRRDLERLERAVRRARFLGGVADACFALGLLAAAVALALRLGDIAVPGYPLAASVLLGGLAWGLRAARAPLPAALPVWLDRAGGHRGLLLAALATGEDAAWAERLDRPAVRVRLRGGRLVRRALPPLALLALVSFLPGPRRPEPGRLVASALADLARELEAADAAGELDAATVEALRERLEELRRRGDDPAWNEVDGLADRLAVERRASGPRRSAAREALRAAAEGSAPLAEALREAAEAGLFQDVPPESLRRLGVDPETGHVERSGGDREDAVGDDARVAEAVRRAVARAGGSRDRAGREPGERSGTGTRAGEEGDPDPDPAPAGADGARGRVAVPGTGAATRGRADAPLRFLHDTQGGPERFAPLRLPDHPGDAGPSRRVEAADDGDGAEAVPDRGEGGAGARATGRATGRRVIRPRHRDVVRRYHEAGAGHR